MRAFTFGMGAGFGFATALALIGAGAVWLVTIADPDLTVAPWPVP